MGRILRRVPLNFDWPLHKVWEGFQNPHYRPCPEKCEGGYSAAYRALDKHVREIMWDRKAQGIPDYRKITTGLAGREPSFMGHDSIDEHAAVHRIASAAGIRGHKWGTCPTCKGSGIDPAVKVAYSRWRERKPPKGPGYQVWETVSEGSPISPVFKTSDELISWLVDSGYSRSAAISFVEGGWAPSAIIIGGTLKQNIEALGE